MPRLYEALSSALRPQSPLRNPKTAVETNKGPEGKPALLIPTAQLSKNTAWPLAR